MMLGLFSRVQLIILDGLTKEMCIASAKRILSLAKKSGSFFTSGALISAEPVRKLDSPEIRSEKDSIVSE